MNLPPPQIPGGSYQDYSVFIGDLPFEATDESILNLFKGSYASLTGSRIARDAQGRSKGIGFVRFSERADQLRAIEEMNGCTLFGRKLRLEESVKAPLPPGQVPEKKQKERERMQFRGGGGGGGGGGGHMQHQSRDHHPHQQQHHHHQQQQQQQHNIQPQMPFFDPQQQQQQHLQQGMMMQSSSMNNQMMPQPNMPPQMPWGNNNNAPPPQQQMQQLQQQQPGGMMPNPMMTGMYDSSQPSPYPPSMMDSAALQQQQQQQLLMMNGGIVGQPQPPPPQVLGGGVGGPQQMGLTPQPLQMGMWDDPSNRGGFQNQQGGGTFMAPQPQPFLPPLHAQPPMQGGMPPSSQHPQHFQNNMTMGSFGGPPQQPQQFFPPSSSSSMQQQQQPQPQNMIFQQPSHLPSQPLPHISSSHYNAGGQPPRKNNAPPYQQHQQQQQQQQHYHNSNSNVRSNISDSSSPPDASSSSSSTTTTTATVNYSPQPLDSQGNTTVFVGGLSLSRHVTEADLFSVFKVHGPIYAIRILPKGCGFVVFQFRNDADRALNTLNGVSLGPLTNGGQLRLSWGKNEGRPMSALAKKGSATGGGGANSNNTASASSTNINETKSVTSGGGMSLRGASGAILGGGKGDVAALTSLEIEKAAATYFASDYSDPLTMSSSSMTATLEERERLSKNRERFLLEFGKIVPTSIAMSGRQIPELPVHLMNDDFTPP